tara:strand:+ start:92 stop:1513 length:1422 start_codon:yes stop_codon:yes gene_type:complete
MKYIILLTVLLTSGAFASAFDDTLALAQQGDPESQRNLAFLYESGGDIEQDFDKAFSWYSQAAIQGDSLSAWKLGDFYSKGLERAIANHGNVSVIGSVLSKRGMTNIVSADPINIVLTGLTAATITSERAFCSSGNPDHYIDAYKWYQIANIYNPEKKRLPDSEEIAGSVSDYTNQNETSQVMKVLSMLPYLLKGQIGRSEEQVARYYRNKFKALGSVLSDKQKSEAKELAAICVNSNYQDCAIGDYNATDNQPHSFQTTLYDQSTKWKVSECTKDGKLKAKYLSVDSGYIDQIYSTKGIKTSEKVRLNNADGHITQSFSKDGNLVDEAVFKDDTWKRKSFYENGSLSEETFGRVLTADDRSKLSKKERVTIKQIPVFKPINRSKYSKNGQIKYKVNYWPEINSNIDRFGKRFITKDYKTSQEFYSKDGQLTRKIFYKKKGNKPLYTNYYKADGTLKRSKNADGSRRSIKKSK